MTLDQVLADLREEAAILARNGHTAHASSLVRACDRVAEACPDYLRWLSEPEAIQRSGMGVRSLRGRFPEWERAGHARKVGRVRYYRAIVLPIAPIRAVERQRGRAA